MALNDAVTILFERSSAAYALWNLQMVVVLGILGFLASSQNLLRRRMFIAGVVLGYLGFAVVNVKVIRQVEDERRVMELFVTETINSGPKDKMGALAMLPGTIHTPPDQTVILMHVALDCGTVLAIVMMTLYMRKDRRRSVGSRSATMTSHQTQAVQQAMTPSAELKGPA